jgi:phosphonate transport system substrate-binding protein
MICKRLSALIFPALFLPILAACGGATATAEPAITEEAPTPETELGEEARALVFGDISDDPGEVIEGTQPMADYVASQLAEYGITGGEVKVAASVEQMIEFVRNGEVDIYMDTIYPATVVSDATGAQIVLRRWKFGVEEYVTVIFASQDSGITSLDELRGHMIAFDAPYSTSGFAVPAAYLTGSGLTLVGKETYGEPVGADEVGFTFSYDDENTLQWVLRGLVAAGATDDFRFDVQFPEDARADLVELARTDPLPRQVVVIRAGLEPELVEAIVEILLAADETPDGQAALEAGQTTQFDEFPEGIEAAVARMRGLLETVQAIPLP